MFRNRSTNRPAARACEARSPRNTVSKALFPLAVLLLAIGLLVSALMGTPRPSSSSHDVRVYSAADQAKPDDEQAIDFNRDIRPILSDKCYSCHGPDSHDRKADLRLDTTENGDDFDGAYFAIEPGDPDDSELIKRIHHSKSRFVMPPPESGLSLTDEEKKLLRRWIEQGAVYKKHWSFEPIAAPPLPEVNDQDWPRQAIDQFVLASLERRGMKPSPEAPRHTLLRRLTLDLTGLPPTPEEIAAFVKDESEDAYEKAVDRLLASPRYGERMALPWLDAARYADTNGFSIDDHRDMWLWREWVIDAFNRNMPYDQFVVHQLAGDLLPDATDQHRLATGFLRNSMNTHEGGTIPAEYRVIYIADKIDTVSTVFMGLTMRCAQCHDHKYDPLSMQEYYQMYAFFDTADIRGMGATNANTAPVIRTDGLITDAATWKQDVEQRIATLKRYLIHPPELLEPRAAWEREQLGNPDFDREMGKILRTAAQDRSDEQWQQINEAFAKTTRLWGRHISTIKREIAVLEKDLKEGQSSVMVMKEQGPRQTYVLSRGQYDQPDKDQPVGPGVPSILPPLDAGQPAQQAPQPKPEQASQTAVPWQTAKWVWDNTKAAQADQDNAPRYFRFVFDLKDKPSQAVLRATADNRCTVYLNGKKLGSNAPWMTPAKYDVARHLLKGRNVIAIEAVNEGGAAGLLASLIMDGKAELTTGKNWRVSKASGEGWTEKDFDDSKWAAASELGPASMAPWRIRAESSPQQQPQPTGPTRLDLANWLVQPNHPLTARVAVNRTWQMLFGRGLVSTPNDFGNQGAFPTHPELLDYLAADFIANSWDIKRLIKMIVMSSTYRQSSSAARELIESDPHNELLARASRFRLPAEFIRDGALAISGRLDPRVGGSSVYPSQPHGLWREVSHFGYGNAFTAQAFYPSDETGLTRRSMYTFWKRTSPPPSLTAFDAPTREVCVVQRSRTNTPLQALVLLNDPEYFDAAKALAKLALANGGDDVRSQIDFMFRRATARTPDQSEKAILLRQYFDATKKLIFNKDAEKQLNAGAGGSREFGPLTVVASVILNLDETITRE